MRKTLTLLFTAFMLTACNNSPAQPEENDIGRQASDPANTNTIKTETRDKNGNEHNTISSVSGYINDNHLNITNIYGIDNNKYLLTEYIGGKYSVQTINLKSGEASEAMQCDTEPSCSPDGFWVLNACDDETMYDNYYDTLYTYDFELNKTGEADLSELRRIIGLDVDLSEKEIYYSYNIIEDSSEYHRLEKMNFNGDTEPILEIKYTFDRDYWLGLLNNIKYCSDRILFLGSVSPLADGSQQTVAGFGTLNIDDPSPDYTYRSDSYNYEMEKFDGGAIIHDGGMPLGVSPSGYVEYFRDGEQHRFELQNPYETPHIYVSQSGQYFATTLIGENENGSSIYRITVYDADGNVLKTEDHSFDGTGIVYGVYVSEYSKTIFYNAFENDNMQWYEFTF